ncbi:hypothetical protein GCM10022293_26980 [Azospirillum formosense]
MVEVGSQDELQIYVQKWRTIETNQKPRLTDMLAREGTEEIGQRFGKGHTRCHDASVLAQAHTLNTRLSYATPPS